MAETTREPISESFVCELRTVLGLLYDWVALRSSPLIDLLGLKEQDDPPLGLREVLMDAIEALKPSPQVFPSARVWRLYRLLLVRYVEQFTQAETATELGLSIRHLRREEMAAVQRLATYLWDHYGLDARRAQLDAPPLKAPADQPASVFQTPSAQQELGWLEVSLPDEPVDLGREISSVLDLLGALAETLHVDIEYSPAAGIPPLLVQRTTLRQALLTVCDAAIRCAPDGSVSIATSVGESKAAILIISTTPSVSRPPLRDEIERLDMARQLIELSQGSLEYAIGVKGNEAIRVQATLPAADEVPVLVIEDNLDTLQLLERCLSGSRYQFIGAPTPERALELIEEIAPKIIVLDVMLPGIDGWELLGRLRQHPCSSSAPVVVCSILPQEQLALTLGAAGFIRKPVSRDALLSALDQLTVRWRTGSC